MTVLEPLPVRHVAEITPQPQETRWLIEELWLNTGVGLLGGQAKTCKTYIAAEIALAVATGRPALGRFNVTQPGTVLFFGAEDSPASLRTRFEGLAQARGCDLNTSPVKLIDVPLLHLDRDDDRRRLCGAIEHHRPKLLVLDPFVRLVSRVDENSAHDVSGILGSLRAIQREFGVAILLTHHARKSPAATPYQAFRGSSDFAAWSDSNLFIMRKHKQLTLHVEHRSAPSPEPIAMKLEQEPAPHLVCKGQQKNTGDVDELTPIASQVRELLRVKKRPLSTTELRQKLCCRRASVVEAIDLLQRKHVVQRTTSGVELLVPVEARHDQHPT